MKKTLRQIQDEIIERYNVTIDTNSKCWKRMHAHVKERRICKWRFKSSAYNTYALLHEIGHCETNNSTMRRCEQEYYASQWALDRCKEYGIEITNEQLDKNQWYIYRELERGLRKGGNNYPTREQMKLKW